MNLAVLASTSGTDLPAVFKKAKILNVPCILVTNKSECGAVEKAKKHGVQCFFIDAQGRTREEYDSEVVKVLQAHNVDIVLLIGYMRIISHVFVNVFSGAIYNIHPSLLPAFAGGMDSNVHEEVLQKGCKITGATLHVVTEEVDEGLIVMQKACEIHENETVQSLKEKVQILEQEMLIEFLEKMTKINT